MSDVEEPPSKMSKYTDLQYLDECEEALDEGQEEWLSEGVLTDDDYNPASDNLQTDVNEDTASQEASQEQTQSKASPTVKGEPVETKLEAKDTEQDIEDTLNSLDAVKNENGLAENLNTFLIRKSDGQVLDVKTEVSTVTKVEVEFEGKVEDSMKKEMPVNKVKLDAVKDDGNDTDELLRMLGDDNGAKKKTLKMVKCEKTEDASSDDDEFVYESSKMRTLQLGRSVLQRQQPAARAQPEDMSDVTDASSDEASTVKRMFGVTRPAQPAQPAQHVRRVTLNTDTHNTEPTAQKPIKQYTNKNTQPKSILKPATPSKPKVEPKATLQPAEVKTPAPFKPLEKTLKSKPLVKESTFKSEHLDEIIDEEFLEDDGLDVDELGSESESDGEGEGEGVRQRIRRPERMDDDELSDDGSHTDDGSLYDELPSSDSDDMDDWFSLDIRAERASDYLPLLGCKARALLVAERGRVETRVATLRQSLAALTASARRQADQLRAAAMALAELDDTLRAA